MFSFIIIISYFTSFPSSKSLSTQTNLSSTLTLHLISCLLRLPQTTLNLAHYTMSVMSSANLPIPQTPPPALPKGDKKRSFTEALDKSDDNKENIPPPRIIVRTVACPLIKQRRVGPMRTNSRKIKAFARESSDSDLVWVRYLTFSMCFFFSFFSFLAARSAMVENGTARPLKRGRFNAQKAA